MDNLKANLHFSDPIIEKALRVIQEVSPSVRSYLFDRSLERLSGVSHQDQRHEVNEPRSAITEADLMVNKAVLEAFRSDPVSIVAEEGSVDKPGADYRIVLDDLDGTYNASQGVLGRSAISLAIDKNQKPLAAIWHNPYFDETVFAEVGRGALYSREGRPFIKINRPSATEQLDKARIFVVSGIAMDDFRSKVWHPPLLELKKRCLVPLDLGSSVISLMDVALGGVEGFVIAANKSWDLWGAIMIFTELGIPFAFYTGYWNWKDKLTDEDLNQADLQKSVFSFVSAANPKLFRAITEILTANQ